MSARAKRLTLFALEVALVVGYLVAFGVFVFQSEDFIVQRNSSRAAAAAAARPPALPAEFRFGDGEADNALLGPGWHQPVEGAAGIWTKAPASVLLPVQPSATAVTLLLDGQAFVAPGRESVDVSVAVDNSSTATWTVQLGQPEPPFELTVGPEATADGLLELRIDAVPLAVPYHYDRSDEKRKVGFLLRGISLTSD